MKFSFSDMVCFQSQDVIAAAKSDREPSTKPRPCHSRGCMGKCPNMGMAIFGVTSASQHRSTIFLEFVLSFHSLLGGVLKPTLRRTTAQRRSNSQENLSSEEKRRQSREVSRSMVSGLTKAMLQMKTGCFISHEASL